MKNIFITGSTGVVGSSIIPKLLEREVDKIYLLMRAKDEDHLQSRLQEIIEFYNIESGSKLIPVRGDIEKENFGIDQVILEKMYNEVEGVIHSAASINMNKNLKDMRKINVDSCKTIINICKKMVNFKKLEYVSSVGVSGRDIETLDEVIIDYDNNSYRNNYEQTKAEAEKYIIKEIANGMKITIHRPSMVVGSSVDFKVYQYQIFYYICDILSGEYTFNFLPKINSIKIDIIPVNYVAKAICNSLFDQKLSGQIFNLCSSEEKSPKVVDIAELIYKTRGKRPITIPRWMFDIVLKIVTIIAPKKLKRGLKLIPIVLGYMNEEQFFINSSSKKVFFSDEKDVNSYNYLTEIINHYFLSKKSS